MVAAAPWFVEDAADGCAPARTDSGAARKPSADAAPDAGGISTWRTPSTRATSAAMLGICAAKTTIPSRRRAGPAFFDDVDTGGGGHMFSTTMRARPPRCIHSRPARGRSADFRESAFARRRGPVPCGREEEAGIVVADNRLASVTGGFGAAERSSMQGLGRRRRNGADAQQADLVDCGDGAAAGADLDHVDHGRA